MMRFSLLRGAKAPLLGAIVSFFVGSQLGLSAWAQAPMLLAPAVQGPVGSTDPSASSQLQQQSQLQILPASQTPPNEALVASVLEQGRTLESQRRWGEAFALYEDTVRLHFGQPMGEIETRLDLAKMHFDIGRRYADSSFRKTVGTLSDTDALQLYTDSANKVQSHYVQNPDWNVLVNRGTSELEIALSEKAFQDNNLGQVSPDRVDQLVRDIRRQQAQHPARSVNDARNSIWNAAQLGQSQMGLKPAAIMMEYTAGMLGGLDEFSSFLTSGQLNDLYSQIEGNFVGLGVELKASEGSLLIVNVIHHSPAEKAGIKGGDRIVSVGSRATTDLNTDKAAELLQGPEGSTVDLSIVSGNQPARLVTVRRAHVDVPSVDEIKIVDQDFGIGYFKLTCFQKTTNHDVDQALWQLHRDGMRSLVIDLRGNPGGLLTSAVDVANKFVDSGSIVSTHGRSPGEDYDYKARGGAPWRMPLVILIDGDSASAAEILAGALRDYHRATIVGTRSYGKGSVQGIFPLSVGGAGVRLTTAKFYSPLGKPFSHVGVEPDAGMEVRTAAKPIDGRIALPVSTGTAEDAIFNAGIQAARQQLAQR